MLAVTAVAAVPVGCAEGTDVEEATMPTDDVRDSGRDGERSSDAAGDAGKAEIVGDAGDEEGVEEPEQPGGGKDASSPTKDASSDASSLTKDASSDAAADASFPSDASTDDGGAEPSDAGVGDGGGEVPKPTQGEIVISEVMYDANGTEPASEWIEVYNAASSPRALSGLAIRDGSNRSHTILPGVVIAPGAYAVLASDRAAVVASKVPAAVILYAYNEGAGTDVQLANSANGGVVLLDGTTEVARAHYGLLGLGSSSNGQSIQLKALDYASAGAKTSWCYSSAAWTTGSGKGTPGAPSDCAP